MAEITVASSEFEDTVILSNSATTNYIDTTVLTFGKSSENRYNLILQLELAKRPRFIPYLGGSGNAAANIGYTAESAFSTRTAFFSSPGLAFISQIDPSITVDMGGVTYNKANSGLNWTTAGGLDDLVDETQENFTFDQTSANQDFDVRLSARYTRRALFGKINIIFYNNDADDITTLFSSQETGSGNAAEVILRGRFTTRNRENPIRSRKFGVR
jgi:hypothetical protein